MLCAKAQLILAQVEVSKLHAQYQQTVILSEAYKIACKEDGRNEEQVLRGHLSCMYQHIHNASEFTEAALEAQTEFEETLKC